MVNAVVSDSGFEAVLSLAQAGDERAIGQLYRSYNPSLIRFFGGQAPDVKEDLAQEVWVSVAAALASFEGDEGRFRAWLFTIARRRIIDHWRLVGRRPREVGGEMLDLAQDEPPDQLAIQAAVQQLTAGLTDEQTEVVLLRVVAGLSVDQVAAMLDKSPGAIRVMQHRALRRLAELISNPAVTP
jgi:RNA polymerase sigma-70 factor (ECF subfamily)